MEDFVVVFSFDVAVGVEAVGDVDGHGGKAFGFVGDFAEEAVAGGEMDARGGAACALVDDVEAEFFLGDIEVGDDADLVGAQVVEAEMVERAFVGDVDDFAAYPFHELRFVEADGHVA